MTYGVIDVGSNTIRLCIYSVQDGEIKALFNSKNTAGLIGYVNDGELSAKGIKKACDVLNAYKEMAHQAKVEKLYVFATASLRNITNTKESVSYINKETGLKVDVLSGHDEAVLDFEGVSRETDRDKGLMVDIGGGSTEILIYNKGEIIDTVSLDFGSLSMYSNYVSGLFPQKSERKAINRKAESELSKIKFLKKKKFNTMIGVGGTIRAVKKLNNDIFELPGDNCRIAVSNMEILKAELQEANNHTLKKILRVAPDRVHTLIPGMLILDGICQICGCKEIITSNFGVREGYLCRKVMGSK